MNRMNPPKGHLSIYFQTSHGANWRYRLMDKLSECIQWSPLVHSSIGVTLLGTTWIRDIRIDSRYCGEPVSWLRRFERDVAMIATMPVVRPHIPPMEYSRRPTTIWPSIIRTFGTDPEFMIDDCLCDTLSFMQDCGIGVPRNIRTLHGLYQWTKSNATAFHIQHSNLRPDLRIRA